MIKKLKRKIELKKQCKEQFKKLDLAERLLLGDKEKALKNVAAINSAAITLANLEEIADINSKQQMEFIKTYQIQLTTSRVKSIIMTKQIDDSLQRIQESRKQLIEAQKKLKLFS